MFLKCYEDKQKTNMGKSLKIRVNLCQMWIDPYVTPEIWGTNIG